MEKYRKKPAIIEAEQWFRGAEIEGVCWCGIRAHEHIHTLEGVMRVRDGDWIIKGLKGEYYACKPDIFEMTYELV